MNKRSIPAGVIFLAADAGRDYPMGGMRAVFKADNEETRDEYSISEWWLQPGQPGPGPHSHEANDDIFYVLEGVFTFQLGDEKYQAGKGAFIRVPAGVVHDFENNSENLAGLLNIYIPGGFEKDIPAIVEWFKKHA
jgi:quercetin dioxygenase-like cupin family protein